MYERHRLAVFRYIYGLTGGAQEDAEDLTAETFLRAWKARHRFEGDIESAIGWLLSIAKRLVLDGYRRSQRTSSSLPPDVPVKSTPERIALGDEQRQFLFTLMADLPHEQREILSLRYLLGWRVGEIAKHVGTTENNVSVIIHRTLSKLREKWLEYDAEAWSVLFVTEENIP
jgi:RNA polymerase sigma-70 factor (ECF subfamily)